MAPTQSKETRSITLCSNFFTVDVWHMEPIYKYNIKIKTANNGKKVKHVLQRKILKDLMEKGHSLIPRQHSVWLNESIYTTHKILNEQGRAIDRNDFTHTLDAYGTGNQKTGQTFEVVIEFSHEFLLAEESGIQEEAIPILQQALTNSAITRLNLISMGGNRLLKKPKEGANVTNVDGAYFLHGYFQSLRYLRTREIAINVDVIGRFCERVDNTQEIIYRPYNIKSTKKQTEELRRKFEVSAEKRKEEILEAIKHLSFANDKTLKNFVDVHKDMIKFEGKVLQTPTVIYRSRAEVSPTTNGDEWNMEGKKFFKPTIIKSFGVLNLMGLDPSGQIGQHPTRVEICNFVRGIQQVGREMGIELRHFGRIEDSSSVDEHLSTKMREMKENDADLELIFVILNGKRDPSYGLVKTVGDLQLNLTTQCVDVKTVRNICNDSQIFRRICLKLNAKRGGTNHLIRFTFPFERDSVLILGADVTHPKDNVKVSIAAVVGTADDSKFQYYSEFRPQPPGEMIRRSHLEAMVLSILERRGKGAPMRVIYFRDGVGNAALEKVKDNDVSAIRKACQAYKSGCNPLITMIVVQKGHHARLFPENKKDACGLLKNVPPGTAAQLVAGAEKDFHLVSHRAIVGTSRPGQYRVLHDDSEFTEQQLQQLTYDLCHTSGRCNLPISYPPPCLYAHLMASRVREYICTTGAAGGTDSSRFEEIINASRKMPPLFFI